MSDLKDARRTVGYGLALAAAIDFTGNFLHERPIAAAAVQLAIAELGAGKLGVAWSSGSLLDRTTVEPSTASVAKRALRGAAIGVSAAIALTLSNLALRSMSVRLGAFDLATLATGLAVAVFGAARDELLLRGLPIRAFQRVTPPPVLLAILGAAAIARAWFQEGMTPEGAIVSGALGVVFGCLWLMDKGAWMAVGANAALALSANTLLRGPLDARAVEPPWGGGALGILAGRASVIGAALVLATVVVLWRQKREQE